MVDYNLEGPKWGSSAITWAFATANYMGQAAYSAITQTFAALSSVFQNDIVWAFKRWEQVANLSFTQVSDSPNVGIRLGWTFIDGPYNTVGIAQYAYGGNGFFLPDNVIEFDSSEYWVLGSDGDYHLGSADGVAFRAIALHEIGHELGLAHYTGDLAIMNPTLSVSLTDLTQHDINGIQTLYEYSPNIAGIYGGGGRDTLTGGAGDQNIDGGDGLSLTDTQKTIFRLYGATLNRLPDVVGMNGWTDHLNAGASLAGIAKGFVTSVEFQNVYGALSNTSFVTLLYNNALKRSPDSVGLSTWVSLLNQGWSRADVVLGFSDSVENRNRTELATKAFATFISDVDIYGTVFRLYGATLNRPPDPYGFVFWAQELDGGWSLQNVTTGFIDSLEFRGVYGALNNTAFVTLLYNNVLGRSPDPVGLSNWVGRLNVGLSRESIVVGFSDSEEYKRIMAGPLQTFFSNNGPAWADTLTGGTGNDNHFGGLGPDTFRFAASEVGSDHIYGYQQIDTLALTGFSYSTRNQPIAHMSQFGGDVVFADHNQTITFHDVALSTVTDSNFTFV